MAGNGAAPSTDADAPLSPPLAAEHDAEDLSVETVVVDYYMAQPLPQGALVGLPASPSYLLAKQVPVMRVFGATPAGQKTCVHVHGLFPYFYFRAEDDPAFDDADELRRLLPRIALELEKANELKQKQNMRNRTSSSSGVAVDTDASGGGQQQQQQTRARRGHASAKLVAKLLVVQGTPFYGFHARPRLFVQIFLYNPRTVASVVQLLESGCIAERVFQPYEAHIPFLLQVFADYNIEGMNALHLSNVMFRAPLPAAQDHLAASSASHDDLAVLLRSNVPSSRVNGDVRAVAQIVKGRSARVPDAAAQWFDRQSLCALEVDVAAECILNPRLAQALRESQTKSGELRNVPSLAALWEEERQRRIQNGDRSTPEMPLSANRNVEPTPQASAAVAQSAASSLLSQSFFRQKMEDAASKIIDTMLRDNGKTSEERLSPKSSRDTIGDVLHPGNSLSISSGDGDVASVRNNTIATESAFSFSQIDHDAADMAYEDTVEEEHASQHEDQAIMELLLSMQRPRTDTKWEDQVRSQLSLEPHRSVDGRDDESTASDADGSDVEENDEGGGRLDEIGDILASQKLAEPVRSDDEARSPSSFSEDGDADPPTGAWWDVAEQQAKSPTASSVLELGSPRIDLERADAARHHRERAVSTSVRVRQQVELDVDDVLPNHEDSEALDGIEDLLPPPPPPRPQRRRHLIIATEEGEEEEDSVPFDPLNVSLTPQPIRRRDMSEQEERGASLGGIEVAQRDHTTSPRPNVWLYSPAPPSLEELVASSKQLGIEAVEHRPAFYSVADDIPEKPLIFSGKKFDFKPVDLVHTPQFSTLELRQLLRPVEAQSQVTPWLGMQAQLAQHQQRPPPHGRVRRIRTPARPPPTVDNIRQWCTSAYIPPTPQTLSQRRKKRRRVAEPLTTSLDAKRLAPSSINSSLTVLSLEVHANSRGDLLPDPRHDRIDVLCYAVEAQEGPTEHKTKARGVIICRPDDLSGGDEHLGFCIDDGDVTFSMASDEKELITKLEELVRHWDPDFVMGFEVQKESIGFLVDRASQLNVNLIQTLSRLPTTMVDARNLGAMQGPEDEDTEENSCGGGDNGVSIGTTWGVTKASGLWIHGRFILNLWRLARSEVKLSRYAREDIVRAVLKREFPIYSPEQLTSWYKQGGALRWKTVRYTLQIARINLQLLSRIQLITRTSEMARLFGMDFYSVLSRGSQYRVESMMLRVTKRRNYLLVSPSRTQVARQAPMECIPLVMEPQSSYYSDPVVVLDFQSLYPSLVIGYNLCYSTIYGRLREGLHAELEKSLGVVDFTPSAEGLLQDRDNFIMAPNGVLLSSKPQRLGVLPVILDEILSTRIMVKNAMKMAKQRKDARLEKVLNARQLALKMIANVTYGYTAAGFSGRMPCAQLADSIVQSGRCTLEAALRLVEGHPQWNAKVVYGDTDSLFVLLRGRSKEDAFRIGQEIADAVTAANPKPVTLKLEKVYMGCVLVSKKRYVGLKYESLLQADAEIESKGIETVRRDSCGVVQTSMQRCLELLFRTSDLSVVKQSLEAYWIRILDDQLPLHEFVFSKEVRLGTYARGSAPPAALVSAKAMAKDPRAEPRYAERVPYLVVNGPPGARLMDLVVSPAEFLDRRRGASLSINYQYYIHKQMIPSLERLFLLMGANVRLWFAQLPRTAGKARASAATAASSSSSSSSRASSFKRALLAETRSIDSFYMSKHCRLCGTLGQSVLCADCECHPQRSEFARQAAAARRERTLEALRRLCAACGDRDAADACGNVSCGVWNRRRLVEIGREQDEFAVEW